jgi:hypothetical protein
VVEEACQFFVRARVWVSDRFAKPVQFHSVHTLSVTESDGLPQVFKMGCGFHLTLMAINLTSFV